MKTEQIIALINLLKVPLIGPQKVRNIVNTFNDVPSIFSLSEKELCSVDLIDQKSAQAIRRFNQFDWGKILYEKTISKNIDMITCWDEEYPFLLKKIYDPPVLLYAKGQSLQSKEDCVAIVGTRACTQYGKRVALQLAEQLSLKGIVIVSGLARGIDTFAHKATVNNAQRTISVLGSGIDVIYPSENRKLVEQIIEKGTIVSEFPIGTKPDAPNFPRRNRIISGISHGTIVVEAGDRSGAILTALNAVDQNREVFAIPGRIDDKQSLGCIRLIRNGAIPVKNGEQVIATIQKQMFNPLEPVQQAIRLELSDEERKIMVHMSHNPIHIDDLSVKTEKGITTLLALLLSLELKGAVVQIGGKQFVLA